MPSATSNLTSDMDKENSVPVSISTSANVHVVNDPTNFVTDAVSLPMELFVRLFPDSQRAHSVSEAPKCHFVLMKFLGVPDFFPRFDIYKVSSIDEIAPTPHSITLTNHARLASFGPHLTFTNCIIQSIDVSSIPELDQIFVAVPESIYDILDKAPEISVREKFAAEYLLDSGGVLSQGSVVRPLNATVKLCEPFYQGRVTGNTNIVFIKENGEKDSGNQDARLSHSKASEASGGAEQSKNEQIDLSEYLSQSMVFDSSLAETSPASHALYVLPLPYRISVPQETPFPAEDPELHVFLNSADLAKLGFPVFSGDLVEIHTGNSHVVVKVFTFLEPHSSFKEHTVYLSPLLLVNLDIPENAQVVLKPHAASAPSLSDAIPIAEKATIARIVSPITMDKTYQRSFFAELKSTFHTQKKCFKLGDVFPVCIDSILSRAVYEYFSHSDHNEEEENQDAEVIPTGNPDSVAWFKVMDISGAEGSEYTGTQLWIDPKKTSLTSSGVEFMAAPKNRAIKWNDFLGMPPIFDFFKAFSANPADFKYASEFYQVLNTALRTSGRTDLRANILLHSMSRGLGKSTLVRSAALDLGLNLIELDAMEFVKPGAELKSVGLLTGKIEKQLAGQLEASHCETRHILYIKHIETLCAQVDVNEQNASTSISLSLKIAGAINELMTKYTNIILVASSNDVDMVSDSFRKMVTFEINIGVPSESERLSIIDHFLNVETRASRSEDIPDFLEDKPEFVNSPRFDDLPVEIRQDVQSQTLALQSAGLTPPDLKSIVRKAKQSATLRLIKYANARNLKVEGLVKAGNGGVLLLIPEDFEAAISDARNQFSDSIGAPRIPNVKWADIGGLDLVKDEILDTIDMPMKHPELFSNGLKKRSGILFYGPPGTGKTLLAKAIATNFSLNFFSVKGPELLNMYIGESEANVRRVFQRARDAKPCVIFFDELDSVAPKRGNQGDSGGVMDRIVSQLLAELDGMSGGDNNGEGVFVVGATNRPDLLDEALLRPGRFDKMLYLGISDTNEKQAKILEALTRKFKLGDDVDLASIAEKCTFTFTGADFYALCSDSMLNAMTRTANDVDRKLKKFNEARIAANEEEVSSRWWFDNVATKDDIDVLVSMADFEKAQRELSPSVSAEELEHYLRVKENFEGVKKKPEDANGFEAGHDGSNGHSHSASGPVDESISKLMNGNSIIISEN